MARRTPPRGGVTKGKLALIAGLGVVLIGVVASNFSSNESDVDARPAERAERPAASALNGATSGAVAGAKPADGTFGEFAEDHDWTPTPAGELAKFDPFDDGEADVLATPAEEAAEINELRNAQNAIIFTTNGQTVAQVGAKQYRVGDVVGGLEIQGISSAGIVLRHPD